MAGRKGHRFSRLIVTTCLQGAGAPIIDGCSAETADGHRGAGVAIKPSVGTGRALVVAWSGAVTTRPPQWLPSVLTRGRFDRA